MKKIAIIGGGACGSAALIELIIQSITAKLQDQISFVLIERKEKAGYGLAFGSKQRSHILNTQADLMGIYANEPAHFAEWLKENGRKYRDDVKSESDEDNAYTSRLLYGHYVSQQLDETIEKAKKNNVSVERIKDEAYNIDKLENEKLLIHLSSENTVEVDEVLLAPGTPKPNIFTQFKENSNYIDFPWPTKRLLEKTNKNDHVGVLGSSLSAIDTVMTLVDNGHEGKITMFSPDGMLPRVQPDEDKGFERKYLTLANLHKLKRDKGHTPRAKELFRLFIKDVEAAEGKSLDWKSFNRHSKDPLPLLEYDIEVAEKGGDLLSNMAYSMRYDTSTIWSWMSLHEQILFTKWLGRHWTITRHAIPLYNAKRLAKLLKEGKLEIIPQNNKVEFLEDKNCFKIATGKDGVFEVDKLVNATGSAGRLEEMDNVLVQNLLEKKYLKPHPIGGAVINTHTMQCMSEADGDHIYGVGHLVNGMLMDVNAVWFNVRTIARLASEIIFKTTTNGHI
ncbi:FAD/NAD(P)-binding protein [Zunongwangia endophytica]|uniref:FAD/NAD(P)-binding protein n=1 Tax=Zunongwangia endophytica TaxID=1808945 RepID=A0ABV8HHD4_9FLAO|nr:FAD/NAD(P)-binding protein [Zunongwangia endophytica]MDN3594069.1 FAD/NAD(P)-binding protein [Zunongwangia endophytica]